MVLNAASFAAFFKQGAVFVLPFTPGIALTTFPFFATVIRTTTTPSSWQSGCFLGVDSAFLPAKL